MKNACDKFLIDLTAYSVNTPSQKITAVNQHWLDSGLPNDDEAVFYLLMAILDIITRSVAQCLFTNINFRVFLEFLINTLLLLPTKTTSIVFHFNKGFNYTKSPSCPLSWHLNSPSLPTFGSSRNVSFRLFSLWRNSWKHNPLTF